ncbi:MAG TPA: hypothetical protein VG943_13840 [Caulobacterales bacterium]|nr:hypothetical protein [Caulobacterales bacterium]
MTDQPTQAADDAWTIAAIAVLAACAAAVAHEAVGHGGVCLALGGKITQLTSVYFQCSARSTWIAAGGPLGNLGAALAAWLGLAATPRGQVRPRLLLFLIALISLFWFAGYLLYAALFNDGDPYFVAADLFGGPSVAARAGMVALALASYWLGLLLSRRFTSDVERPPRLLAIAWFAASLSACFAALLYAPDRLSALKQGTLEIGAACLPMLSGVAIGPARTPTIAPISRDWIWIGAGTVAFALFAATLGRGL